MLENDWANLILFIRCIPVLFFLFPVSLSVAANSHMSLKVTTGAQASTTHTDACYILLSHYSGHCFCSPISKTWQKYSYQTVGQESSLFLPHNCRETSGRSRSTLLFCLCAAVQLGNDLRVNVGQQVLAASEKVKQKKLIVVHPLTTVPLSFTVTPPCLTQFSSSLSLTSVLMRMEGAKPPWGHMG